MKNPILILGALIVTFLALAGEWLYAQRPPHPAAITPTTQEPFEATSSSVAQGAVSTPTVGTPVASPNIITVNTSTAVTITVQITDPTLIPGSVNLLLIGATGTQPTILGVMQSTGNGIYTIVSVFNTTAPGQIRLQVSAAFQGLLRRVLSSIATVSVWNSFSDPNTGISFAFPPMNTSETIYSVPETASSAATLDIAAFDPATSNFVPVLGITVDTNASNLTLQQWFEQKIDIDGLLLSSGAAKQEELANGLAAIFISGQIPDEYLIRGAPVSGVYVMSPSGENVLIIDQPEDASLADFGTSTQDLWALLPTILGSLSFS